MVKGALLLIAAALMIPFGDAVAKYAHLRYDVPMAFMAWSRFALGAILIAPFALWRGVRGRDMAHGPVLARGVLIGLGVWFILQGAARAPLADVYGAFFIAPILSFVLAVLWLGERPRPARAALVGIGFCGVVLVVKPGAAVSLGMGMALLAGGFYGAYLTLNRYLAGRYRPMAMLWAQLIVAALILAPFGMRIGAAEIGPGLMLCILVSAASSAYANLLLLTAYGYAEATRLAPLVYVQLISATLWGVWIFGEWPDLWAALGLVLLLGSGFAALALGGKRPGQGGPA